MKVAVITATTNPMDVIGIAAGWRELIGILRKTRND